MAKTKNNKAKQIKNILLFIYAIEFIYIIFLPELMALYIYVNTIITSLLLVSLIKQDDNIIKINIEE